MEKKMKIRQIILTLFLLTSVSTIIYGQTDVYGLKLYGFYQTSYIHYDTKLDYPTGYEKKGTLNSFWFQQMNVFLSKDINDYFSTFVNLEFTNSYSSEKNWGALDIEEAWIRYSKSNLFSVKAGILIPNFNNLNEIKNRTILLPYIFRPFVYESTIGDLIAINAFVPSSSNIEVAGMIPIQDLQLNYSAYMGNSEDSYIQSNASLTNMVISSIDTSKFKLVGGRVGLGYDNLKLGISTTFDKSNKSNLGIGDVSRVRIGADLSFAFSGFKWESEYINVKYSLDDAQSSRLVLLHNFVNPLISTSLDKVFYYGVLTYNITDDLYVYGKYDYLKDKADLSCNGMKGYSVGGGYKPTDDVLLKVQYQNMSFDNPLAVNFRMNLFLIGASVLF
jgi:hypothetical protein